jgi:hypothetical protein
MTSILRPMVAAASRKAGLAAVLGGLAAASVIAFAGAAHAAPAPKADHGGMYGNPAPPRPTGAGKAPATVLRWP